MFYGTVEYKPEPRGDEEPINQGDGIESIREAEETRRGKMAAKLKEQCRLEALATTNEARER